MRKFILLSWTLILIGSLSATTIIKRTESNKKPFFPGKMNASVRLEKKKITEQMRSIVIEENADTKTNTVPAKSPQAINAATALFNRPSGTYLPSLIGNEDPASLGYYYSYPGIFGSAYSQKWKFPNLSTGATSYSWDWGSSIGYSKDTVLSLYSTYTNGSSVPFLESGAYYVPVLNAISGTDTTKYALKGADNYPLLYVSTPSRYVSNADFYCNTAYSTSGFSQYIITASGATSLTGSGTGYYWGSALRATDANNSNKPTKVNSVVTFFAKPMSPMVIKDICLFGVNTTNGTPLASGVPLKVSIIKVSSTGGLSTDTIASSTITSTDLVIEQGTSAKYIYIPVTFKEIDPETGREGDLTVVVKDRFAVVLSGLEQTGVDFGLYCDYKNQIENTSYFTKVDGATGTPLSGFYSSSSTKMNAYVMLNAYFNYLYVEPTSATLTAPASGGSAVDASGSEGALVYSMFNVVDTLGNTLVWVDETTLPDWLTLSYDDSYYESNGALVFDLKATALPEGVASRSATVKLLSNGAEATVTVNQSNASDVSIVKSSGIKISASGNKMILTYPSAFKAVEIYNVTGQLMGKYSLSSAGSTSIPADAEKGTYLLRFTGAKTETVKVIL